jgi:hypothetical protein
MNIFPGKTQADCQECDWAYVTFDDANDELYVQCLLHHHDNDHIVTVSIVRDAL